MYEIIDIIHDYLFVTLRLRNVQTGVTREWKYWDDLEEWLCKESKRAKTPTFPRLRLEDIMTRTLWCT